MLEGESNNKEVNIFDFDNTLFRSPTPNPKLWNRKFIGSLKADLKDNGLGWFQSPITLSPKYIDQDNFIESTVEKVIESMNNPNAVTVLLTGRNTEFTDLVKGLLSKRGLEFDYVGLKPTTGGLSTINFKFSYIKNVIQDLKTKNYNVNKINIWEDREEHVKKFNKFFHDMGIPFKVNFVSDGEWFMPEDSERELVSILVNEHNKKNGNEKEFDMYKKPNYYALVLDDTSRTKLLSSVQVPEGWKNVAHHMTIVPPPMMGKESEVMQWALDNIGKEFSVKTKALGLSDAAMAVAVDGVSSLNKVPHITVAVPQGGSPKNSLNISNWKDMEEIELSGKVEAVF